MAIVSIGMPAYNGERFIREAIESLQNQTYHDWTLFISDDASTDSTQTIYQEYASKDRRITYHRQQKNIGMFSNFRFVFDHRNPNAEYYMQAAHDDIWNPKFIETCMQALEEKGVGVAFTGMVNIDGKGTVVRTYPDLPKLSGPASAHTVYRFLRQPEILGKANCMYGLYTIRAAQTAWEYAPHRMQWAHDALFSLAAIGREGLVINPAVLFKKRTGGFGDQYQERTLPALTGKTPSNFIPIGGGKFTNHIRSLRQALQGTGYKNMATLIMLGRGVRPTLEHLATRDYKKRLRSITNIFSRKQS